MSESQPGQLPDAEKPSLADRFKGVADRVLDKVLPLDPEIANAVNNAVADQATLARIIDAQMSESAHQDYLKKGPDSPGRY